MNSSSANLEKNELTAGVILSLPKATAIASPESGEYMEYFQKYISLVPPGKCGQGLVEQVDILRDLFADMDNETAATVHAPYTWSLSQVLGHLVDCERVFGYRAARIAAGDKTELPGFDEGMIVQGMRYADASAGVLFREWVAMRIANVTMFSRMTSDQLAQKGSVDGKQLSARAAACVIAGHTTHHLAIVMKRLEFA